MNGDVIYPRKYHSRWNQGAHPPSREQLFSRGQEVCYKFRPLPIMIDYETQSRD